MAEMVPGGYRSEDGRSIVIHLVPGTPETGLWCGRCLLASAYRVPVYTLTGDGPHFLTAVTGCTDERHDQR